MRRLLILSSLLLWVPSAWAQDVSVRFQSQLIGSRGTPLANQNVAVCNQPANTTTTPCSPLASLGTSVSTTTGGANPTTTDLNGNFFFYAPPGKYTLQIYGPAIATPFVQPDTTVPQAVNNTVTLSANQTFTGSNTLTNLNGTVVVDGTKYTTIQAGLNAAAVGGTVFVPAGCGGTVATPAATVTILQAVRLVIQCNITSSQVPNISIQSSGVTIEGSGGNSPSGGSTDAIIWTNSGTGNTIIYGDGVTSFRGLVIEKLNFRDSGAHLAARTILFKPNAADISIRDVATNGIGFDGSAGNQALVRFERVRVNNYVNFAFNFDCTGNQFCNSITFNSTYADLGTGTGVGYNLGNGNFILQATDSDFAPTCNYRFVGGGTVNAQGTDDEQATTAGWCITGGGANSNVTLVSPKAVADALPISITGGSNVTIINPNTTGTTGTNSIVLGAGAVGQNFLFGTAGLDKINSINAAASLQTFGTASPSGAISYSFACPTSFPCLTLTADTFNHGAALQVANSSGNSYNFGELFSIGTFDIRSTSGGGGFSFNSNGGAGRGIFTFTNTADRIYTFPNVAATIASLNNAQTFTAAQTFGASSSVNFTSLFASPTAPTIAGAGCGGTVAAIQNANGTASFEIFTGTAPTSAGCTVTFPAAAHHWICPTITHTSAVSTTNFIILQTGALSTTSVTFQLFSDVAAATAPAASDTWAVSGCHAN